MTRLIDADALKETLKTDPLFKLIEPYNIIGVIDAQPTVEVISVEWIKTEAEKIKETAPLTSYAIKEILRIWKENQ